MVNVSNNLRMSGVQIGEVFWSPIFGRLTFSSIVSSTEPELDGDIIFHDKVGLERRFDCYGHYRFHGTYISEEVMVFPSDVVRNWGKFATQKEAEMEDKVLGKNIPVSIKVKKETSDVRSYGLTSPQWDILDELVYTGAKSICGCHLSAVRDIKAEVASKTNNQDLIDWISDGVGHNGVFFYFCKNDARLGLVMIIRKKADEDDLL